MKSNGKCAIKPNGQSDRQTTCNMQKKGVLVINYLNEIEAAAAASGLAMHSGYMYIIK